MKKIILFFIIQSITLSSFANTQDAQQFSKNCYQAYQYNDDFKIKTSFVKTSFDEKKKYAGFIHTRALTDNLKNRYRIFWFETNDAKIDVNSIHSPFIVSEENGTGFSIKEIKTLAKNNEIQNKLLGLIELTQFNTDLNTYQSKSSSGAFEVTQEKNSSDIIISRIKPVKLDDPQIDVKIIDSKIKITPSQTCFPSKFNANETLSVNYTKLKSSLVSMRDFSLIENKEHILPSDHWFMSLDTDITKWKIPEKKQIEKVMTQEEANLKYDGIYTELLQIKSDDSKINKWALENMDFLKNLHHLLTEKEIDDELSRMLFAELGFINTEEVINILADVILKSSIPEKERFRALMALKNTTIEIPQDKLDALIQYGLDYQDKADGFQGTLGMLIGTLAKERLESVPAQVQYINEKITASIMSSLENKHIPLAAAGNMYEAASNETITAIESVLISETNDLFKKESAQSLRKIGKTNISAAEFNDLWNDEKNNFIQDEIIRSSSVAEDAKNNSQYQDSLIDVASKTSNASNIRLAALEALINSGYGKQDDHKSKMKQLIYGETDRNIALKIQEIYRAK